ncbi:carbohydrate ABC transporter permease [Haloplasma contractile]|uniref:ABC transporter permease protein n=1 Tax=Haloplasma contractile SSD-17B TaxID=1033810 RepID=U2FRJ9_9MOLU|nr:sugar ABC transporter permease [Haloplasma contractile]ERJ13589.1 ABC transporter permease protein [Haloplasma contractile SSD-17B]
MDKIRNFIWTVRNRYYKVNSSIRDNFKEVYNRFVETKAGAFLHKYLLRHLENSQFVKGALYLSPVLVLLGIFTFYPIINTMMIAFYKNYSPADGMMDGYTLENFTTVLKRPGFKQALQNTAIIVLVSVPISVIISLFIAVMLNSIKKMRAFFQTVFFLPYVTNVIAIGLVFSLMFNSQYGLINKLLEMVGLSPVHWQDANATYWSAMATLLIYTVWKSLAFKIMVFTAGLSNIDKQFYDAAKVDGTPKWRVFTRITVPLLSPMIAYVTITSFIGAFKAYTTVVSLFGETGVTAGGKDMRTIVFYVYEYIGEALQPGELSKGAAASLILFGIILLFTVFQLYISKKRVHY